MNALLPLSILFAVLLYLKIAKIGVCASWSWWLVLAPFWLPVAAWLFFVTMCWGLYFLFDL